MRVVETSAALRNVSTETIEWTNGPRSDKAQRMRTPFTFRIILGLAALALVSGCQGSGSTPAAPAPREASLDDPGVKTALDAIKGDLIKQHMSMLADDKLEGRGLGTAGYDGALNYVETHAEVVRRRARRREWRLPAARAAAQQRGRRRRQLP